MADYIAEYCHFFTATNLEWKKLLLRDKYKEIIIESMRHLVTNKKVIIYGFVLMNNHIHLLWQMRAGVKRDEVQRDFLKHTAQEIKNDMLDNHKDELLQYLVNAKDRKYQFWERNALSVEIWSEKVFLQKLKYLHANPVRAGLCNYPLQYKNKVYYRKPTICVTGNIQGLNSYLHFYEKEPADHFCFFLCTGYSSKQL